MKSAFPVFRIFVIPVLIVCSFISCSTSSGIDDYYTFNVGKSQGFTVPPQVPVGQDVSAPFVITIDSADLVTSTTLRTTIPLMKSVKLTKLSFTSSDASYPMTSFDTIKLVVSCDSLEDQLLATYIGANDAVTLTNADFAAYLKQQSCHYKITFRANKAPAQPVNITATDELVFTAKPQQ